LLLAVFKESNNLRGEDDGLTDHLASGALGDGNSVGAGAGSAADESVLVGGGPAPVADVAPADLAVLGVTGITSNHTETLFQSQLDILETQTRGEKKKRIPPFFSLSLKLQAELLPLHPQ